MKDSPTLQWLASQNYFECAARRRSLEVDEYEQVMPHCCDPNHPTDLLDYLKAFPEFPDGRSATAFWLSLPTPDQRVDLYHHLCHWLFDWGVDKGMYLFAERQRNYKRFLKNNPGVDLSSYQQLLTAKLV